MVLAGCVQVRLVEPHDPVIVDGLTEYYETTNTFLAGMADAAGDPAGTYAVNKHVYNETGARLDTLILRARSADDDGLIRTEQAAGPFAEFEITTIVSPTEAATDPAYAGSPQSEVFERVQIRHPGVWPGILARELAGLVGARHRALRGAAALDVLSETSDMNGANTMNEQAGSVR